MAKTGRPSKYTDAILKAICDRLSKGEPLAQICREEDMPAVSTVWQWQQDKLNVSEAIAHAREIGFDAIAAECLDIADDGTNDWRKRHGDEEDEDVLNHEHISRSKLRVETRLKLLAKWDPKRYGDKTLIGSDPENPLPDSFAVRLVPGAKRD